ncbi:MAG: hypothetical protein WKG00_20880 [Polyangiaceae bacterium]
MGAHPHLHVAATGVSLVTRLLVHAIGELVGPSRCAACARSTTQLLAIPKCSAVRAPPVDRLPVSPLPDDEGVKQAMAPPMPASATAPTRSSR